MHLHVHVHIVLRCLCEELCYLVDRFCIITGKKLVISENS